MVLIVFLVKCKDNANLINNFLYIQRLFLLKIFTVIQPKFFHFSDPFIHKNYPKLIQHKTRFSQEQNTVQINIIEIPHHRLEITGISFKSNSVKLFTLLPEGSWTTSGNTVD